MTALNLVYRNDGEQELHAAGCSHTRRRDFQTYVNFEQPVSSLREAAKDYAEALNYSDGEYETKLEDGSWVLTEKDKQRAIDAFESYIKVLPCAAKAIKEAN